MFQNAAFQAAQDNSRAFADKLMAIQKQSLELSLEQLEQAQKQGKSWTDASVKAAQTALESQQKLTAAWLDAFTVKAQDEA
jgi:hypothetical protein